MAKHVVVFALNAIFEKNGYFFQTSITWSIFNLLSSVFFANILVLIVLKDCKIKIGVLILAPKASTYIVRKSPEKM